LSASRRCFQLVKSYVLNISRAASTDAVGSAPSPIPSDDGLSRYVPRRACLYVPGNDEKKLRKIPDFGVDCAVLDCEDGVALNRKVEARSMISQMLGEIEFGQTEPVVRINSVDSGLAEDDLKVIFQAKKLPQTFMLPKSGKAGSN